MPIEVHSSGPPSARVMIVGEAPGGEEERTGVPFSGTSGWLLNEMLAEAGMSRESCFVTNVCRERPPGNDISLWISDRKTSPGKDWVPLGNRWVLPPVARGHEHLLKEIAQVRPNLIICAGNTPFWAISGGKSGITKWRGSQLTDPLGQQFIPIIHPASILREWKQRQITVHDLRRAARWQYTRWQPPTYDFVLRPSYVQATDILNQLYIRASHREPLWLSFDIETRAGHIACAGLAWSRHQAICLPLMCTERPEGYWSASEECWIVGRLRELLTHPNVRVIGQNILYDAQYTWKHWGFAPRVAQDTMISQHALFSDLPKSLAFLASMYADYYLYWKDEGKLWEPGQPEDELWHYNGLDCVYTFEVAEVLRGAVQTMHMEKVHDFQQSMLWPVLRAMQLGIRVDRAVRDKMILEVQDAISLREKYLTSALGHSLNPDSSKQMHTLFYEDLKQPVQMKRATRGKASHPTLDDDALNKIALMEPLLKPIVAAVGDIRTLRKFLSNFLTRPLDEDGRWRCSFNIGGSASGKSAPKTYRLSSSESAFGTGANFQNVPSDKSKSLGKAAARGGVVIFGAGSHLPNLRSIFVPDPGWTMVELDLQRADLFVVCWEANDEPLKHAMLAGADIHLLNAFILLGRSPPPLAELIEGHPLYTTHRTPLALTREFAKVFCHGTNYGGGARTMAAHVGRPLHEVEHAQQVWFAAHPGIRSWHDRVKADLFSNRFVENKLGYRWHVFDRLDGVVPEAIAWIPQSTVSVVINKIWLNIFQVLPWVQVLAQVHDSLLMQVPTPRLDEALVEIRRLSKITIPYPDPLVIPVSIKVSSQSWGSC